MRQIELLAPAKNKECGIDAINHGADAVYIGAPKFGARLSAGNSIEDIQELITYAHLFNAKVYVALNTIIFDNELKEVEEIIHRLYDIHADAIIVQDMGILQLNLPPISFHASTQVNNQTLEKVQFLEQVGFQQVVLARELSLREIRHIAQNTSVALEVFIHGALCVSYSGQCYASQALCHRSANRGECAQICRLPYDLVDSGGKTIFKNKHALSLKDLHLSENLEALIDAGVTSFKIEGRLKDSSYVKNITAFYRQKIDAIIDSRKDIIRSSSGKCTYFFTPNPQKTFYRGSTSYFLLHRNSDIHSFDTPKSIGEKIGTVKKVEKDNILIDGTEKINNGDGLCFLSNKNELEGFRVNKSVNQTIYPAEMPSLKRGILLHRNLDFEFIKQLSKKTAERKIDIDISVKETESGFDFSATDENNNSVAISIPLETETAQRPQEKNIEIQLSKLGDTIFKTKTISINIVNDKFMPSSVLTEARRSLVEHLLDLRKKNRKQNVCTIVRNNVPYPEKNLIYLGNVSNEKAKEFYQNHGVKNIQSAFELQDKGQSEKVMFCKACIKYALGYCPKYGDKELPFQEPLVLIHKNYKLQLEFDCKKCEMHILA